MIFAVETEERTLYSFPSEEAAIAYCEGLDVEAAIWLFWDDAGQPLAPQFTVPNRRGLLTVTNGTYKLIPAGPLNQATLDEALDEIIFFETGGQFDSKMAVLSYLSERE